MEKKNGVEQKRLAGEVAVTVVRLWFWSFAHAAQWRLLLFSALAFAVPAVLFGLPVLSFLGGQIDRSTRAADLVANLDFATFVDLASTLKAAEPTLWTGALAAAVGTLVVGPAIAGAALAVARLQTSLDFRPLLKGVGELYGRMLRLLFVAIIPLGAAGALAFGGRQAWTKVAERATHKSTADLTFWIAIAIAVIAFFLARLTLDAARGVLSAEPHRRSAFLAWIAGLRLVARRPVASIGLGLVTSVFGGSLAACLLALRFRIIQSTAGSVLIAAVLAQATVAAIAWARAGRVAGFRRLAALDAVVRQRLISEVFPQASLSPVISSSPNVDITPARGRVYFQ